MRFLAIFAALAFVADLRADGTRCQTAAPLAVRVREFQANNVPPLQALLQLGSETQACLAIEALDEDLLKQRVSLHVSDVTVGNAIRRILQPSAVLMLRERAGVVAITTKHKEATWLDYALTEFRARESSRAGINNLLWMIWTMQVEPSTRGFAGHYRPDSGRRIGPFHEKGKTMRQLLDLLLTSGSAGAWIAYGPGVWRSEEPQGPFWELLDYGEAPKLLFQLVSGRAPTPRK